VWEHDDVAERKERKSIPDRSGLAFVGFHGLIL
jgi:hypothetical protein